MKYDLDISVDEKLRLLADSSFELVDNSFDYRLCGEKTWQPSHVYDYEQWKKEQKR